MLQKIRITTKFMILVLLIPFIASCSIDSADGSNSQKENSSEYKVPKYIFFFIGDGMALPQINLAQAYANIPENGDAAIGLAQLNMTQLPVTGLATTFAENRYITGSAAAGTALATGEKTTINTISKKGDHSSNLKTIAEMAKEKGMRVGIVSSVSIDHATPAAFYAHEDTRKNMYNIAKQMTVANFDYYAGGYAKGDYSADTLRDIKQRMLGAGYKIVSSREGLQNAKNGEKLWAYNHTLDAEAALWYEIDREQNHIALEEFTQKGIELLDNPNGFFMMVEGGKIDWACHANDAVTAAKETIAFDKAIGRALEFYKKHPDETLIIVTADHECGGLTLGFANTGYESAFEILKHQKISAEKFADLVAEWKADKNSSFTFETALTKIKDYFGLGNAELNAKLALSEYELKLLKDAYIKTIKTKEAKLSDEDLLNYSYYEPLTITTTHILNRKAGIGWTSYSHTGLPVTVFAIGQGQNYFTGYYDNTDIPKRIMSIGRLRNK